MAVWRSGHHARAVVGAHRGAILVVGHVPDVGEPGFDAPVAADVVAPRRRIGLGGGQIGQPIGGFVTRWGPSRAVTGRSMRNICPDPAT